MNLITASLTVSLAIAASCALPWYVPQVRKYSRALLLLGTAVLLGFVLFDLIPEMIEIGGSRSLIYMGVSLIGFTILHALADHRYATHIASLHEDHSHGPSHAVMFLLGSMALHCFAGGVLLVSSYAVSESLVSAVVLSLLGHKAFEAISVASVMIDRIKSRKHLFQCIALYAVAFPLGVAATALAKSVSSAAANEATLEEIAMILTSVAVGSLMGCLLQDFLLPALREITGYGHGKGHKRCHHD